MKYSEQPAFPVSDKEELNDNYVGKSLQPKIGIGLTKREYFAAMAMQGMLSNSAPLNNEKGEAIPRTAQNMAMGAVKFADALLKQLEQ